MYYNHLSMPAYLERGNMKYDYVPLVHIAKQNRTKEQEKQLSDIQSNNATTLEQKSKWLYHKKWADYSAYALLLSANAAALPGTGNCSFKATVENPGLLFGTGITHESGNEGEFKIGFYFDHATGLVVIPGHSIKGMLRSFFSMQSTKFKEEKCCYIHSLLHKKPFEEVGFSETIKKETEEIESEMFDGINANGDRLSVYEKDIFYSAFITDSKHSGGYFLGRDAITPHGDDPLKNPTPLPFLKLLPNTELQFNFHFKNGTIISAAQKKELVKTLITNYGIGAKTNVGYGQFKHHS